MPYRLLQVALLALACAACGSRQVTEPARVDAEAGSLDSGVEAGSVDSGAEAGDADTGADAGLRQYPCKLPNDCDRYFGFALCVGGFCCLGNDDGHGHCVCGTLDGGCQDPRTTCCADPGQPMACHDMLCPGF